MLSPSLFQSRSKSEYSDKHRYKLPGSTTHSNMFRKMAGRLGLDFVVSAFKFANSQLGKDFSFIGTLIIPHL